MKIYPEADRQKATVKVEVQSHQPNLAMIKPEMSVKTNFLAKPASNREKPSLVVPAKALLRQGSGSCVWAVCKGQARRVSVVRGDPTESGIEIRQGLEDGDVVMVAPSASLSEGQRVETRSQGSVVR